MVETDDQPLGHPLAPGTASPTIRRVSVSVAYCHRVDCALLEPVGQAVQIGGEALEAAHGRQHAASSAAFEAIVGSVAAAARLATEDSAARIAFSIASHSRCSASGLALSFALAPPCSALAAAREPR